ncbi:MAG: DUF3460 family protein [Burkholderiales bacterium]
MKPYESEHTRFMRRYLEEHPEEVESQKKGRAVWWDKTPQTRSPLPASRHAPLAGGNEYTFEPLSEKED